METAVSAPPHGGLPFLARARDALISDVPTRETFELITRGACEASGFRAAALALLRTTDEYEYVAVSADGRTRTELLGGHVSLSAMLAEIENAEQWGGLRYLPAPRAPGDDHEQWHADDILFVPLVTGEDRATPSALLFVDDPVDGRRPGPAARERLATYAGHAQALIRFLDRQLSARERIDSAARERQISRIAAEQRSVEDLVAACSAPLLDLFGADDIVWHDLVTGQMHPLPNGVPAGDAEAQESTLIELARLAVAPTVSGWEHRRAVVVGAHRVVAPGPLGDIARHLPEVMDRAGAASVMLVPLGVRDTVVGTVLLTRHDADLEWQHLELEAAIELGGALGRAVQTCHLFAREQSSAAEKQRVLATLAHDLKNPLTALRGYQELLAETLDPGTPEAQLLDRVARATGYLTTTIDALLLLAQLQATDLADDASADLSSAVRATVADLSAAAAERGVTLVVEDPPTARVRGTELELRELVARLLQNAIGAHVDGGTVTLTVRRQPDAVIDDPRGVRAGPAEPAGVSTTAYVLTVEDTGIGIAAEHLGRITDEFYVVPRRTTRPEPDGPGLGLSIARRITERSGGTLDIDSRVGRGTTVAVRLAGISEGADR
ncbi:HAMP domain-containing sensor histidine kinase [Nocardioides sp. R-C-SC26]|uniref:sensor histidine kinase n=1 Tax=Nocardioides sp. R-C-SC26 TaxID=2870414 RepID=UPI001E658EC0|nr:HAMP domain-containing sensor histidine kinase [Nocardioides sp. R-C-SC26]